MFSPNVSAVFITPHNSIRQAILCIDRTKYKIALVVDGEGYLLGTVTDGDVRRAILAGIDLDLSVQTLLDNRAPASHPTPLTAAAGTSSADLLHLMNSHSLRHIPLVDQRGRVVDLALLSDLVKEYELPLTAVVMAGGYGMRLRPLTEEIPKSMLPVGDRPLMELIIEQLRNVGIRRVNLATHYRRDVIAQHFGDGQEFGVEICYVEEDEPLGTVGALSLLETSDEPILVINGDILTRVDFHAMLDFHREHQADMTVAVKEREIRVPYGVVETDGVVVKSISEKPVVRHLINAGIYLLSPQVCRHIPNQQACDMPDLINRLIAHGSAVVTFPIREYWLDIGQLDDYQKALRDFENTSI